MIQLVALMSVFGLGICFSVIGALKLKLAKVLNIDDAKVGGLITALMFSSIFVVLAFGPLVDMFGYRPIAITGFILGSAALFILISTTSYSVAFVSCILLGIGAMCLNLGNTLIPMVLFKGNPAAASNFGNVFFGLGAFITPFLVGMLLSRLGYRATGTILAVILLAPVVFAITAIYPAIERTGISFGQAFCNAFGLLANPVIIIAALALFCYVSLEVSMGGWITTYLSSFGIADRAASFILSGFWIALMAARLIAAATIKLGDEVMVIRILAVVAAIAIVLMTAAKSKRTAGLLVLLVGFAFGPLFPSIVGFTFSRIDPSLYGSAFGIIFAVGLLGGSTIPAMIGVYSKGKTIQKSLVIAAAAAVILVIIALVMGAV